MVCAPVRLPVRSIIPSLKLGDYIPIQAHKPCSKTETEHGLCAYTVDNSLAKTLGLSLRTGAQTMLYLSLNLFLHGEII